MLIAGSSCAADESKPGAASAPIVGGAEARDPAVGAIAWRRTACRQDDVRVTCSGVLIAPRVLLTAAHCLDLFPGPGAMEVAFSDRVTGSGDRWVTVIAGAKHPKWDRAARRYDAALLRLADPVDAPPLAFDGPGPVATEVGQPLRAIGFGVSTPGESATAGIKREGMMTLSEVDEFTFFAKPSPGLSCEIDSGGPVLIRRAGIEQLLGITISGDPGCAQYARHTRVDILVDDFIQPFIDKTASTPAGRVSGSIPPDRLCQSRCNEANECPGLLPCVSLGEGAGRCQISEPAGDYGDVCQADSDCASSAKCGRLWSTGADACRCLTPCDAVGEPPATPSRIYARGGGCGVGPSPSGGSFALAVAAALVTRRRRSASSTPSS